MDDTIKRGAKLNQDCARLRDEVRTGFSTWFSERGYINHPPGDLISSVDTSTRFTGSTISTLKPYLQENATIPSPGLHITQSCLRTQNVKLLTPDAPSPVWSSYFSSIGVLGTHDQLDEITESIVKFLTHCIEIDLNRLRVRISSHDSDLQTFWKHAHLTAHLEIDTKPQSYYVHRFGMEGVSGRNCNLAIVARDSAVARDIGNIIVIEREQRPIGIELAFGVETIVSRILDLPTPINAAPIAEFVEIRGEATLKLADALSAAIAILWAGVRPTVTNQGRILRAYLQSLSILRGYANLSIDTLESIACSYEKLVFQGCRFSALIGQYLRAYEALLCDGRRSDRINAALSDIFPLRHQLRDG